MNVETSDGMKLTSGFSSFSVARLLLTDEKVHQLCWTLVHLLPIVHRLKFRRWGLIRRQPWTNGKAVEKPSLRMEIINLRLSFRDFKLHLVWRCGMRTQQVTTSYRRACPKPPFFHRYLECACIVRRYSQIMVLTWRNWRTLFLAPAVAL